MKLTIFILWLLAIGKAYGEASLEQEVEQHLCKAVLDSFNENLAGKMLNSNCQGCEREDEEFTCSLAYLSPNDDSLKMSFSFASRFGTISSPSKIGYVRGSGSHINYRTILIDNKPPNSSTTLCMGSVADIINPNQRLTLAVTFSPTREGTCWDPQSYFILGFEINEQLVKPTYGTPGKDGEFYFFESNNGVKTYVSRPATAFKESLGIPSMAFLVDHKNPHFIEFPGQKKVYWFRRLDTRYVSEARQYHYRGHGEVECYFNSSYQWSCGFLQGSTEYYFTRFSNLKVRGSDSDLADGSQPVYLQALEETLESFW